MHRFPHDRARELSIATVSLAVAAVGLLAVHQHLIDLAALAQHGVSVHSPSLRLLGPSFYLGLPYRVLEIAFSPPRSIHLALIALAAAESAVLYGLYRTLRGRATAVWERVALATAALAMLAIALNARTVIGFDLYAYAGYAKLGMPGAYAPPAAPFPGEFRAINDAWGTPMLPAYYGPLWVALAQAAAGGAKTLGGALFALRLLAVVPFVAIVAGLARRRGLALAALFALNPALYVLYIADGHTDMYAVAALFAAIALAGTLPLAAVVLAAAAGLVKLPYAVCIPLVFAGRGSLARRAAYAALAVVLVLAGSRLLGGMEYVHDLTARFNEVGAAHGLSVLTGRAIRTALFALVAVGLVAAFVRGIVWRAVSWALVASSTTVYPWYLAGAMPYAVLERGALASFLVLFPLAAALLENAFPHFGLGVFTMLIMLCAGVYEIVRKKQRPIDDPGARLDA